MYCNYITSLHDTTDGEGAVEVKNSLEFALDRVGQDLNSGHIWIEYIGFLQALEKDSAAYASVLGKAAEGQGEAAKIAALRRTYHRALVIPTSALDTIWSMYESFENSLGNKTLAKRSLDEWRPRYHASKSVYKERKQLCDALDTRMLPLPPGKGGAAQMHAAGKWRDYCRWERRNPGEVDESTYQARVILAYEQALSYLIHFPDTWLDYASWHQSDKGAGIDAAISVLDRGRQALPSALVLHFAAADLEETNSNLENARSIYEQLISLPDAKISSNVEEGGQTEESVLTPELKTLAWIQYMRFVKREDGVMAARKLFLRAKKWEGLQWQAFVASARLEWANDGKDHIPRNIFELGLKSFIQIPGYVLEYVKFLQGIGDLANARSLFERALTACNPEESGLLWEGYIAFEAECGTLSTVMALESRRRESLKSAEQDALDPLHLALLKYKFGNLLPGEADMFEVSPDAYDYDYYYYEEPDGGEQAVERKQPNGRAGAKPRQNNRRGPSARVPWELHQILKQLSGPADGPVPDVEDVLGPIMSFNFTPEGIGAHESAMLKERRKHRNVGSKRKAQKNEEASEADAEDEEMEEEDSDDGVGGMDVYRRRMRART